METPPPTDTKAEVQPKDFVTATLPINPESTELLFAGQATINCGSGDQERGVTHGPLMTDSRFTGTFLPNKPKNSTKPKISR